ncbi:MAG: hypothetical protein ACYDGM_01190 [Vulcanimicrobiaceae bacterium]
MLRRVDIEDRPPSLAAALGLAQSEPIVTATNEAEHDTALLPHDHPPWVKDALSVSQRARALFATLRPVLMQVLTFWDHRIRSTTIAGQRISIDPSGSYRLW